MTLINPLRQPFLLLSPSSIIPPCSCQVNDDEDDDDVDDGDSEMGIYFLDPLLCEIPITINSRAQIKCHLHTQLIQSLGRRRRCCCCN